jgi:hypothetical protein
MKKSVFVLIVLSGILLLSFSCKNTTVKESSNPSASGGEANSDLIVVGKDIITEVIVKPDSLGDPWQVEKVKNYNGKQMFSNLFENIYNKKVTVYDILSEEPLSPDNVRKMEQDFSKDLSKIAKFQFLEDWYFNPVTNKITKTVKSVSFGYELTSGEGLPPRYKALFRLKMD